MILADLYKGNNGFFQQNRELGTKEETLQY